MTRLLLASYRFWASAAVSEGNDAKLFDTVSSTADCLTTTSRGVLAWLECMLMFGLLSHSLLCFSLAVCRCLTRHCPAGMWRLAATVNQSIPTRSSSSSSTTCQHTGLSPCRVLRSASMLYTRTCPQLNSSCIYKSMPARRLS